MPRGRTQQEQRPHGPTFVRMCIVCWWPWMWLPSLSLMALAWSKSPVPQNRSQRPTASHPPAHPLMWLARQCTRNSLRQPELQFASRHQHCDLHDRSSPGCTCMLGSSLAEDLLGSMQQSPCAWQSARAASLDQAEPSAQRLFHRAATCLPIDECCRSGCRNPKTVQASLKGT